LAKIYIDKTHFICYTVIITVKNQWLYFFQEHKALKKTPKKMLCISRGKQKQKQKPCN